MCKQGFGKIIVWQNLFYISIYSIKKKEWSYKHPLDREVVKLFFLFDKYAVELLLRNDWPTKGAYALFPTMTIVRDSQHHKSPAEHKQGLNLSSDFFE